MTRPTSFPAEQERVLDQVSTLLPHMEYIERVDWVSRLKHWFGDDFGDCTNELIDRARAKGRWPE